MDLNYKENNWKPYQICVSVTTFMCNDVTNNWLDDKLPLAGF